MRRDKKSGHELRATGTPLRSFASARLGSVGISCGTDPVAGDCIGVNTITVKIEGVNADGSASDLAALLKALSA